MRTKNFLTTGEFAQLCKTTKETLFHYDRIDLLKPNHVSTNGYRYYSMEQLFIFDIISMLKETGSNLKEIKEYLHETSEDNFINILKNKMKLIKSEKDRIEHQELLISNMISEMETALSMKYDSCIIKRCSEEKLEVLPTSGAHEERISETAKRFSECITFYKNKKIPPCSPFGSIINKEDIITHQYAESFYFSKATKYTQKSMLHIKPSGDYAIITHKGNISSHSLALEKLLKYIENTGRTINGNCYSYDMMSYLRIKSTKEYATMYCILLK